MKHILLTNDDGIEASGLKALYEALKDIARVTVIAPAFNKSACSHSMSLTKPLKFKKKEDNWYYLEDGTPTDCIFLGLNALLKDDRPDLVISGINFGSNMGEDITYSGTVAGAMEAVIQGVSAIAISQVVNEEIKKIENLFDFELAKDTIRKIVLKIFKNSFPLSERKLLNINIPPVKLNECKGIKTTIAGYRVYGNDYRVYRDPRGEEFYWIGLHPLIWEKKSKFLSDFEAIENNYISITPIKLDLTSYEDLKKINNFLKE